MFSVLVPYRPDGGWRDRAWLFNQLRWRMFFPGCAIVIEGGPDGENPGDFNHPAAINNAARIAAKVADPDVFIVADADTTFDPRWVAAAADTARATGRWVLPRFYDQITQASTEEILLGDSADPIPKYEHIWRGDSVSWSGLVVVPRPAFDLVGGYDERWAEWGGDDVAFACSMNTLWGQALRLDGAAMHLWHPRDHLDAQPQDQHDLMHRYIEADGDVDAMRALIEERP